MLGELFLVYESETDPRLWLQPRPLLLPTLARHDGRFYS